MIHLFSCVIPSCRITPMFIISSPTCLYYLPIFNSIFNKANLRMSIGYLQPLVLYSFANAHFGGSLVYGSKTSMEIRILTFNIWRSTEKMRERMEALGEIVEYLAPDLATFQEVTRDNLAVLQEQRWFSRYHLIVPEVAKQERPELAILSSCPVEKWQVYPFKNCDFPRQRRIVVAETNSSSASTRAKFVIAATHLVHSGFNTKLREEELKESVEIISDYDNVCVMGDLNIEDKVDGDIILPSPWIDAWLSIPGNTDNNGYTWDRSKTPFTSVIKKSVNATSYQARLDRVLCKLSDFKVKEMRIVGDKVTKSGILPSDHFGLFTIIELVQKTEHKHDSEKLQTESKIYFKRPSGWEKLIKHWRMGK